MVSFWPFSKRDDNSPDSFERTLSQLATKIQARNAKIAFLRQRLRRAKALWTLYSIFGWILYVFGAVFIIGWDELGWQGMSGIFASPVVIYAVRWTINYIFEYQINSAEISLADLKTQQHETIEKLKEATRFYSTQSILEKYGDVPPKPKEEKPARSKQRQAQQSQRATPNQPKLPAPETSGVQTPEQIKQKLVQEQLASQVQSTGPRLHSGERIPDPGAIPSGPQGFVPVAPPPGLPAQLNALSNQPPPLIAEEASEPRWYDRILDVLVGEDETSAKARFALICSNCRMVNGLAPPGTRDLSELGQWGCARCGTMNGKPREDEVIQQGPPEKEEEKPALRRSSRKKKVVEETPETSENDVEITPAVSTNDEAEATEEEEESEPEPEVKKKPRGKKASKKRA